MQYHLAVACCQQAVNSLTLVSASAACIVHVASITTVRVSVATEGVNSTVELRIAEVVGPVLTELLSAAAAAAVAAMMLQVNYFIFMIIETALKIQIN